MRMIQIGKKSLRLLVFVAVIVLMLCGCSSNRYEPVEILSDTSTVAENTEVMAFKIGETTVSAKDAVSGASSAAAQEEAEVIVYEEVHDWIVVVADVLNVRAEDNTSARIYVQLKTGDVLERIGYHEEWSKVVYDGEVAYVATSMVEVTEKSQTEEAVESEAPSEVAGTERKGGDVEDGTDASTADENGISIYQKPTEAAAVPFNGHIVAIDAGHQAKANAEKEPIGPGSATKKAKMEEGAVGTVTGVKEYELTLTVAQKLDEELKARGYQTVMIRTGHDVNLSNAERSKIANESDAEILIRLHANSMENSGIYGALAMCMTEYNPYNSELHADSYALSKKIINNICSRTGTRNRGVQKVDNSSAINWCEIPVSVVEMGFLTNPDEDRWLQSEEYQGKIIEGIADAVDSYFVEEN